MYVYTYNSNAGALEYCWILFKISKIVSKMSAQRLNFKVNDMLITLSASYQIANCYFQYHYLLSISTHEDGRAIGKK